MLGFLWKVLISPRSKDKDRSRREFILNILLISLIILSLTGFLTNITHSLLFQRKVGESPLTTGLVSGIFILLLFLSRKGKSYIAASGLVILLLFLATYNNYQWGADLPVNLLLFALIIVIAGILIGTRFAFLATVFSAVSIIIFSYLEIFGYVQPNRVRNLEGMHITDSLVHVIILAIISIVSWLSNREIEKSLQRARSSETALKKERDLLEIKVEKRTADLKRMQMEKMAQLYHFAEFGRISSGIFHDLVNPLQLISLNINRLSAAPGKHLSGNQIVEEDERLKRIKLGIKKMESFISVARKQVQNQSSSQVFSLPDEINEVIQMLQHKAHDEHVRLLFSSGREIKTYGTSIKFQQVVMNIISNAIDAYQGMPSRGVKRVIQITVQQIDNTAQIIVQDWGRGIEKKYLDKIFEPFFTTKGFEKGTGIGLSICRDIIKKEFKGNISAESRKGSGTRFIIEFPLQYKKKKI